MYVVHTRVVRWACFTSPESLAIWLLLMVQVYGTGMVHSTHLTEELWCYTLYGVHLYLLHLNDHSVPWNCRIPKGLYSL